MTLLPLQPISNSEVCVIGDVTIDPGAAIAPGVILQATANSRIVIGAGVCVGAGVVINAIGGTIEIETGAMLGRAVLIVGSSTIGTNACVGTRTTIFNASIEPERVVAADSLIGDPTRSVASEPEPEVAAQEELTPETPSDSNELENGYKNEATSEPEETSQPENTEKPSEESPKPSEESPKPSEESAKASEESLSQNNGLPVSGQGYVNELLRTLFPYGKS